MAARKTAFVVGALAGASLAVAALAGAGLKLPAAFAAGPSGGALFRASTAPVFAPPPGAPESFADIFERVSPAVVSIHVTSKLDIAQLRRQIPGFENFPFEIVPKGDADKPPPKQESSGSGFFISPDGYIVTNNHVVEGAEDIKVVTKDGNELPATVIGRDEGTDLAVLKVQGRNFPFVTFETAVRPRVGDWVVAVGNPFDLNGTATAGIISAYNRDIGENFVDFIQIDAPINKGNSGGPTFDVYGRVIGVNAAIYSPTGGSVGIGFAIPADIAQQVTQELIAKGHITRGYIGATIESLNGDLADSWGLSGRKGAQVTEVSPGGPAEHAGLAAGDVVVAVNGVPIKSNVEMTREVAKAQAGEVIHLDVFRDGKERTIDVHSGVRPSDEQLALGGGRGEQPEGESGPKPGGPAGVPLLGMEVAPLDAGARGQYDIPESVKGGVVVESIKSASDASDKGLQKGDVIVRAGDRQVASAGDLAAAIDAWKKAGRTSIPVAVRRGAQMLGFVPIKIAG